MQQNELISIFCQRPQNFAWFLGAGTSRSAGLPTAIDVIWYLKLRHYCREENQDISRQDIQNDAVRARIQEFMDSRGFPKEWDPQEYSTYFEKIFGSDHERQRQFLSAILSEEKVKLSVGNRVLGALLASELSRVVFSTNFDSVVEKSVAEVSGNSLAAFHLEGARSATHALDNEEYPIYCKLHGDFRHDSLKNLSDDLKTQNQELSDCLVNAGNRFGFIVVGYSGRDESVLSLFHSVLASQNPFPHGLYWTGLRGSDIPPSVNSLLNAARNKGINAEFIEIETFDALLLRLWRNIENKPEDLDLKVRKTAAASASIPLSPTGNGKPILRLNALRITSLPKECLKLSLNSRKEWKELRDAERNSEGTLILTKGEAVWCWGKEKYAKDEFGDDLKSSESFVLDEKFAALSDNLHFKSFLEEALCVALAKDKPLLTRNIRSTSFLIADRHSEEQSQLEALFDVVGKLHGDISGLIVPATDDHPEAEKVAWAEALRVSVDVKAEQFWLTLDPDIWIWPRRARSFAVDFMDERRRDRFNLKFNALVDAWIQTILGTKDKNTEVTVSTFDEGNEAENPSFRIGTRTAFNWRSV